MLAGGGGLLFGGLTALLLGLPHALLQWGLLFLLKRFTRLAPGTRAWLTTLPVLVAAIWMLGERYIRWQPQQIFTTLVQQPAPASLRILDISAQKFEFSEPKLWGIEFTVEPADWASVTNGYAAMASSNDQARESDPELRKQEDELRAEMEQFVRKEIAQCGMELPMKAPFRVLRRTQGDIAARVNSKELRPDWGDFLFFQDDQPGYAFFFRGMMGDDLARLSAP